LLILSNIKKDFYFSRRINGKREMSRMKIYLDKNDLNVLGTDKVNEYLKTIKPLEIEKNINSEMVHHTLKQYIEELEECEFMRAFRHYVYFKNRNVNDYVEVQYGDICKVYLDDEELEDEELKYYLNDEIESICLYL
jgi:hypothetical protein